jgi:ribosomal protein S12 methylthiotransferase accessory factor
MNIEVSFPGGKRVDAQIGEFAVRTDQPEELGGGGSAPPPYDLFLASLATCAGIYVLGFCQARRIRTEGLRLTQRHEYDPDTKLARRIRIEVQLPPDFPEKYRAAIARIVQSCKVKRTLATPPAFDVEVTLAQEPDRVIFQEDARCANE